MSTGFREECNHIVIKNAQSSNVKRLRRENAFIISLCKPMDRTSQRFKIHPSIPNQGSHELRYIGVIRMEGITVLQNRHMMLAHRVLIRRHDMNTVAVAPKADSPRGMLDENREVHDLIKANAYLERALERMCAEADRLRNELERLRESGKDLREEYEQELAAKREKILLLEAAQQEQRAAMEKTVEGNATVDLVPSVLECVMIDLEGEIEGVFGAKDPSLRVNLLEFLRFKSRQIAHGLNMGVFQGMEAHNSREMIAAELRPNGATYVRGSQQDADAQALIAAGILCIEKQ